MNYKAEFSSCKSEKVFWSPSPHKMLVAYGEIPSITGICSLNLCDLHFSLRNAQWGSPGIFNARSHTKNLWEDSPLSRLHGLKKNTKMEKEPNNSLHSSGISSTEIWIWLLKPSATATICQESLRNRVHITHSQSLLAAISILEW